MALLFSSKWDDPERWRRAFAELMPGLDMRVWPDTGPVEEIEFALVWAPKRGELRRFPNLRFIASIGAGVEHILRDPDLPNGVPIVRVVDRVLTSRMSEYVLAAVLRHHRNLDVYERLQRERRWEKLPPRDAARRRAGVLGLGVLGSDAARRLAALGFDVAGWSRSPKAVDGVAGFHGPEGLEPLLRRTEVLVCLLPLTDETRGILDARTLALLPPGAAVVNAARGEHVVDADLIAALDSGHLSGATLDVFDKEPLPADHPFWRHDKVLVTPHVASLTDERSAAPQIVENIRRARAGDPLLNAVDRAAGY